ncbi:MAG: hypothetical protein HRU13_13855, partial [Phycisphaerales bacterium]|nr:hypothetical protein [Phycisphaerales bacterium]
MARKHGMNGMVAALVASAGLAAPALAQIEWDNAAGGDWNIAANWNPMTVPGPGTTASISLPGTYDIFTNASVTIDSLLLTNPNAAVGIGNGRDLRLNGAASTIDGVLIINGPGGTSGSRLVIGNMMQSLGGTGQILMNDTSPSAAGRAQIVDAAAGFTTTIGSDLLVRGAGQMNFTFINDGTIRADQSGRDLWLLNTPKTNNGRMESTDGGELRLTAQINQGPTGEIVADGGDIRFTSTIVGGSIDSTNGLFEIVSGSGNFTDIAKVTGDVEIQNGRDLVIRGGLDMDGTVFV